MNFDGFTIIYHYLLVGGWANPSEKYEFVSWDDDIPNIWKNKKCSKPPTSLPIFSYIFPYFPVFSYIYYITYITYY